MHRKDVLKSFMLDKVLNRLACEEEVCMTLLLKQLSSDYAEDVAKRFIVLGKVVNRLACCGMEHIP